MDPTLITSAKSYALRQAQSLGLIPPAEEPQDRWVPHFDNANGNFLGSFNAESKFAAVALASNHLLIHENSNQRTITCRDLKTQEVLWTITSESGSSLHDLQVHPQMPVFAACYNNGVVELRDLNTGLLRWQKHHGSDMVYRLRWSPDGVYLASCSWNDSLWVWDQKGEVVKTFNTKSRANGVCWSRDQQNMVVATDKGLWIFELNSGFTQTLEGGRIWDVLWLVDGTLFFIEQIYDRRFLRSWVPGPAKSRSVIELSGEPFNIATSPDKKLLVVVDQNQFYFIDPKTSGLIYSFAKHKQSSSWGCWRMAWSANGAYLVEGCVNGEIHFWDMSAFVSEPAPPLGTLSPALSELFDGFAVLARLDLAAPLFWLQELAGLFSGSPSPDLAALAQEKPLQRLLVLRLPRRALWALSACLLRDLPLTGWLLPSGLLLDELLPALRFALSGGPGPVLAPSLPQGAVLASLRSWDDRFFFLIHLIGPLRLSQEPSLLLRLWALAPELRVLPPRDPAQLSVRLGDRGTATTLQQGGGSVGGIVARGDLQRLLPSQHGLEHELFAVRYRRSELLYRARSAFLAPRFCPIVILLDVSPATFGPVEQQLRLAAHIVATSLIERSIPVVLVTSETQPALIPLRGPADQLEIWTRRCLNPPALESALDLAQAQAVQLGPSAQILLLTQPYLEGPTLGQPHQPRTLFANYPKQNVRPLAADQLKHWTTVQSNEPILPALQTLLHSP